MYNKSEIERETQNARCLIHVLKLVPASLGTPVVLLNNLTKLFEHTMYILKAQILGVLSICT
jgi:hypothetical protein